MKKFVTWKRSCEAHKETEGDIFWHLHEVINFNKTIVKQIFVFSSFLSPAVAILL